MRIHSPDVLLSNLVRQFSFFFSNSFQTPHFTITNRRHHHQPHNRLIRVFGNWLIEFFSLSLSQLVMRALILWSSNLCFYLCSSLASLDFEWPLPTVQTEMLPSARAPLGLSTDPPPIAFPYLCEWLLQPLFWTDLDGLCCSSPKSFIHFIICLSVFHFEFIFSLSPFLPLFPPLPSACKSFSSSAQTRMSYFSICPFTCPPNN